MVYIEGMDLVAGIVNTVSDTVLATACPPKSLEWSLQRCADSVRSPE
jgi:hypothetical protein